jgi:hypothetical protein
MEKNCRGPVKGWMFKSTLRYKGVIVTVRQNLIISYI